MPKLPVLSSKEIIKIFEKAGYCIVRQKGSHIRMRHETMDPVTIPNHKIIGRGLLKKLLRDSKMSAEDLLKLMR